MIRPLAAVRSLAVDEAKDICRGTLRFEVHDLEAQLQGLKGLPLPDNLKAAARDAEHALDKLRAALQVIAKA
jgi:hypothetical protein